MEHIGFLLPDVRLFNGGIHALLRRSPIYHFRFLLFNAENASGKQLIHLYQFDLAGRYLPALPIRFASVNLR